MSAASASSRMKALSVGSSFSMRARCAFISSTGDSCLWAMACAARRHRHVMQAVARLDADVHSPSPGAHRRPRLGARIGRRLDPGHHARRLVGGRGDVVGEFRQRLVEAGPAGQCLHQFLVHRLHPLKPFAVVGGQHESRQTVHGVRPRSSGESRGDRPYAGNLRCRADPAAAGRPRARRRHEPDRPAGPVRPAAGRRAARAVGVRPAAARAAGRHLPRQQDAQDHDRCRLADRHPAAAAADRHGDQSRPGAAPAPRRDLLLAVGHRRAVRLRRGARLCPAERRRSGAREPARDGAVPRHGARDLLGQDRRHDADGDRRDPPRHRPADPRHRDPRRHHRLDHHRRDLGHRRARPGRSRRASARASPAPRCSSPSA